MFDFGYTEQLFYRISGIGMFQFDLDLYAVSAYSDRYEKEINDPWRSATNSFDSLTIDESIKHYGEKLVKEWMEKAEVYLKENGKPQRQQQQPKVGSKQPSGQQTCADDQRIDEEQFDLCSYFGEYQTEIGLYMVSVWSEKLGIAINNPWYDVDRRMYLSSYE